MTELYQIFNEELDRDLNTEKYKIDRLQYLF